jgi:hypothetical protein
LIRRLLRCSTPHKGIASPTPRTQCLSLSKGFTLALQRPQAASVVVTGFTPW